MRHLGALREANETATGEDTSGRLPIFHTERARRVARQLYEAINDRRVLHDEPDNKAHAFGVLRGAVITAQEHGDTATEHAAKVLLQRLNDRGFEALDELFGAATLVA